MQITLNGQNFELTAPFTLTALLDTLGMTGKPVVVEHNQLALLPKELATVTLSEGDVIEIIQVTAGG